MKLLSHASVPLPVYMALLSALAVGQLCERSHDSNSIICIQKYELIVISVGIPDSIHAIRFWPRRLCSWSSSCEGEVYSSSVLGKGSTSL